MTPRHLFFAGVPCTGKSLVGRWLADHKNYVHIDAEHEGGVHFDEAGVHGEWNKFLWDGRAREFVQALDKIGRPVVLNWGLPLWEHDYSFVVPALQNESVSAWWFRGNYERAHAAFVAREKGKPENKRMSEDLFDKQLAQIKRHWMLIERIFAPQMVNGLMPDGSQRSAEDIWAEISKARDGDTND